MHLFYSSLLTLSIFSSTKMSDHPDVSRRSLNLLDEFLAQSQIIDNALDEVTVQVQSTIEGLQNEASFHQKNPRRHIKRPREEAHQKLVNALLISWANGLLRKSSLPF